MKRYIRTSDEIFGMAHLNPQKSGLSVSIWSQHSGRIVGKEPHRDIPRVKIDNNDTNISVSLESHPRILFPKNINIDDIPKDIKRGIKYVGRNYDIFLKHYNDTDNSFDDEDVFNELRARGEYR